MSDHAWVQEQIATAVADGLSGEETERFDAHVRECQEWPVPAFANARSLDGKLGSLFASVRPAAAAGGPRDRDARAAAVRRRVISGWRRKLAAGIAATVGLGLTGAGMNWLAEGRRIVVL